MSRLHHGNLPPCKKAAERKNRILSLLFFFMAFISVQMYAQNVQVSGTVISGADNYPIIGANVLVKGTTIGTITNVDGYFTFEAPAGSTLVISYIGYQSQEIKAGNAPLKIVLQEDTENLDEVIVIGYGSQKKSDLTGTIVAVGSDALDKIQGGTVMEKLQGQIPGLTIGMVNARPGESATISVRGENSLSAKNDPLIILDGIPYSGSLSDIDPGIIENMSVLKDASSSAIYGSRAANGVILITTKKGRKGGAQVMYKGYVGLQEVQRRLDCMKGPEYVQYMQDYKRIRDGYTGDDLDPMKILNPSERENYQNGIETDWQDVIFRTALTHSHQVSISGGTEKTTYYGSASYLSQDGVLKNTGFQRANISLNIDQTLNDWLTVGLGTQYSQKETGGSAPSISSAIKQSPYGKLKDENGNWVPYPMDQTLFGNPMADINAIDDNTTRNIFISAYTTIKLPIDGLSYRANFGYNYRSNEQGTYYGRNTVTGQKYDGRAEVLNEHYYDWTFENLLNYDKTFGKHKIGATALFSIQGTDQERYQMQGESFVNDDSHYHNINMAEKNKVIKSYQKKTNMASYMFRLNYGYANKYLLTLTTRGDGYSAFGANNKWAVFPSVAGAWVLSQEEFMEPATSKFLDMLKLRVSYGSNGNQAIEPYQTLDRLSLSQYVWGSETANGSYLPFNGVGNPNLKWETTRSFNIGVDYGFFNGRISGSVDFYRSRTKDLLMSRTVPVMNGYNSIMDNIGSTQNTGVEVTLKTVNIQKKDFQWSSSIVYATNKDKIIELRGDGKDDINNKWFIGEPLRVFYDYKVLGVWQNNDDPVLMEKYNVKPGDAKLWDKNGDGKLNADDKVIIGSKLPKFTLAFSNDLSYKDFYLSIMMNGVFGMTRSDPFQGVERWGFQYNYISGMNYWTPENNHATITSPTYNPYDKHEFYKKVNYWNIRNITLGYNLPSAITNHIGIAGLGVYLGINNVFTFSNQKGYNIEGKDKTTDANGNVSYSTPNVLAYPTARTYTFGLNVTF